MSIGVITTRASSSRGDQLTDTILNEASAQLMASIDLASLQTRGGKDGCYQNTGR